MSILNRVARALAAIALLAVSLSGPASAHATLVSSTPAANSAAASGVQQVRLKFSEPIEIKLSKVSIKGPRGVVATSTMALDPSDKTVLVLSFAAPLSPGQYTVDWQAVAADTHRTHGTFSFTVQS
jgi:methionine-rich copper-binding protein CopC